MYLQNNQSKKIELVQFQPKLIDSEYKIDNSDWSELSKIETFEMFVPDILGENDTFGVKLENLFFNQYDSNFNSVFNLKNKIDLFEFGLGKLKFSQLAYFDLAAAYSFYKLLDQLKIKTLMEFKSGVSSDIADLAINNSMVINGLEDIRIKLNR